MAVFTFSTLVNNQHLAFDPTTDVLNVDLAGVSAGMVRLFQFGANLAFAYGGKTIWLDGVGLAELDADGIVFAGGGALALGDGTTHPGFDVYGADYSGLAGVIAGDLQIHGLDGADLIVTGAGNDVLVGNAALTGLTHVSRNGVTGAPTATFAPTISADGRFVAFEGGWTGFGSSSNSALDVLVKDMTTGVVSNEHRSTNGTLGLSGSGDPVISADGRFLAFVSSSQLLPPQSTPSNTVYVSSTTSGVIEAVSTTAGGVFGDIGGSNPDISADGRYVVFSSRSTNLAAGGNSTHEDIYLKDRQAGAITRISTDTGGGDGNLDSSYAKISADGRFVVFQSAATDLAGADTLVGTDIYLWDRSTGGLSNITGGLPGNFDSALPDVAYDEGYGGVVVFHTGKALVANDTNNELDVYAFELGTGIFTRVSETAAGAGVAVASQDASVSGDGRFVVFRSFSGDLVAGDTNGFADIFVKDRFTGEIALVSRSPAAAANQSAGPGPQISLGGDWIVFESSASNLAGTDGNAGLSDVFRISNPLLKDTLSGGTGNDTYIIARNDVIVEQPNAGTDTVQSAISHVLGANIETLVLTGIANLIGFGNPLANSITGNSGANRLSGLGGNDTLNGGLGDDTLDGGLANDNLFGSTGADSLVGGDGIDTLNGWIGNDTLLGGIGNDRLYGAADHDGLDGGAGDDLLDGGDGDDTLVGGDGNDTVIGGAGVNDYAGGAGNDLYIITSPFGTLDELANAGSDTIRASFSFTLVSTLEHLEFSGSDTVLGIGNTTANVITGNVGANTLDGGGGNDTLYGGGGIDSLFGNAGDDVVDGGTGNDTLRGGEGNDLYIVDSAADSVSEAGSVTNGSDTVRSSVSWTLLPTLEHLTLTGVSNINGFGNVAANVITGNDGINLLRGGDGADTIGGGGGGDVIWGEVGADRLAGGTGADAFVLNSAQGSDTITDFSSVDDVIRVQMSGMAIGDGDTLVEGKVLRAAPGGFAADAELVVFTSNVGTLDAAGAAARIGAATSAYAAGATRLFAIDNGASSAIFLFTAVDANAGVSAGELTLLAQLAGTPATALSDYVFIA